MKISTKANCKRIITDFDNRLFSKIQQSQNFVEALIFGNNKQWIANFLSRFNLSSRCAAKLWEIFIPGNPRQQQANYSVSLENKVLHKLKRHRCSNIIKDANVCIHLQNRFVVVATKSERNLIHSFEKMYKWYKLKKVKGKNIFSKM